MSANKILIADDDKVVHESLGIYLKSEGFEVVDVYDGKAAVAALDSDIALCVLDIMMPEMSGLDVCREIRKTSRVPVIMLTAKGSEFDKVTGLDMGADDYISKPFGMTELISRVKAVIRRSRQTHAQNQVEYSLGILSVDTNKHTVYVDGSEVTLSFKEFAILTLLLKANGNVVSRDELFTKVWNDYYGESRTLDVHIRNLRIKLGVAGQYIQTVKNVGYKIGVSNNV